MIPMISNFLYFFSFNMPSVCMKLKEKGQHICKSILRKELPKPMGRWNIDPCNKKTDQKVDLSNEDHCGPCGQYAIVKMRSLEKRIMKIPIPLDKKES